MQTWHGTPLKRLGHDIHVDENTTFYRSQVKAKDMYRSYDIDSARYNYMISPNAFCTKIFPSAFNINKERLIETGYPRNDVMSNVTDDEKLKRIESIANPFTKNPEEYLIEQETIHELYTALERLSPREQTYLLYRYGFIDGLPHSRIETATHFHLSENRARKTEEQAMDNLWLELPWWF